jgi:hypothetical protein
MSSSGTYISGLVLSAMVASASPVIAADFTTYIMGNSLSADLMSHFRSAANTYVTGKGNTYHWGNQYRPSTTLSYLYAYPIDAPGQEVLTNSGIGMTSAEWTPKTNLVPWNVALPNNRWDAVILEPFKSNATQAGVTDPYYSTLGSDTKAVNDVITQTRKATGGVNNDTKFYIYAAWPLNDVNPISNETFQSRFTAATTDNDAQLGVLTRDFYRNLYNRVHTANPGVSVSVIPVGEVYYSLSVKMQAGAFNGSGLTLISQLYRDQYHANFLGQDIVSWTTYATLFKESPVGLPAGPANLTNTIAANYAEFLTTTLTANDKTLIQQTIWDVVSKEQSAYTNVPEPTAMGVAASVGVVALSRRVRATVP